MKLRMVYNHGKYINVRTNVHVRISNMASQINS